MRRLILAAALALAALAVPTPAQANTGDFESSVYWSALGGDTQSSIQSRCNCTGSTTTVDSTHKVVAYNANNASFAWDIDYVEITYRYNGSSWVAYNGWYSGTKGKMRYSSSRSPYEFYDAINATS